MLFSLVLFFTQYVVSIFRQLTSSYIYRIPTSGQQSLATLHNSPYFGLRSLYLPTASMQNCDDCRKLVLACISMSRTIFYSKSSTSSIFAPCLRATSKTCYHVERVATTMKTTNPSKTIPAKPYLNPYLSYSGDIDDEGVGHGSARPLWLHQTPNISLKFKSGHRNF